MHAVDPAARGLLEVAMIRPAPGRDLAMRDRIAHGVDVVDLAGTHGWDAHLEFGNAEIGQVARDTDFFLTRESDPGCLLAIAQGGIDQVRNCHRGFIRPRRSSPRRL